MQFLHALFGEDPWSCWVTHFPESPFAPNGIANKAAAAKLSARMWGGCLLSGRRNRLAKAGDANQYVAISTFNAIDWVDHRKQPQHSEKRRKEAFRQMHAVMVDDIGDDQKVPRDRIRLPFTAEVETSPGNCQGWYALDPEDPDTRDRILCETLIDRMVAAGLTKDGTDPGMKGVTRYGRLPAGINNKPGRDVWRVKLADIHPERRYRVREIAAAYGLDLTVAAKPRKTKTNGNGHAHAAESLVPRLEAAGLDPRDKGDGQKFDITCPWVDEHTEKIDNGTAYMLPSEANNHAGGFHCCHGHCAERGIGDLFRWLDAARGERMGETMRRMGAQTRQDRAGASETAAEGGGTSDTPETAPERVLAPAVAFVADRLGAFMPATADPLVNESALPFLDTAAIETAARTSTYASKAGRVITHTGDKLIEFGADEWSRLLPDFIGDVIGDRLEYSKKVLETVAQRKAKGAGQAELTAFKTRAQAAPGKAMADYLKLHAQCQTAAFTVDMFATHASVRLDGTCARFTLPFQRLDESGAREDVAADFTEHFPELPQFLRLALMARFAADRRCAFVWLHAPSSWGKALLTSALQQIGILFELTVPLIEKALRGDAVGFDPVRAMFAWIMFVDEFNKASSELKQLNRSISMSAKWQMQTEVDLFVKLFASKEPVRSLIGNGAEEQFNERFSLITGEGRIDARPLMRQIGGGAYVRGLAGYIARVLNAGVAEMRAMGRAAAELAAQRWLDSFQAQHRLSATHGELGDTLQDVADSITETLVDYGQRGARSMPVSAPAKLDLFLRDNAKLRYIKQHGTVLRIRRLPEFVTLYIEAAASRQSAAQLSYRAADIAGMVDQRERLGLGRVRLFPTADCSGKGDQEKGALLPIPEAPPKPERRAS